MTLLLKDKIDFPILNEIKTWRCEKFFVVTKKCKQKPGKNGLKQPKLDYHVCNFIETKIVHDRKRR